jgi:hypothetical protein
VSIREKLEVRRRKLEMNSKPFREDGSARWKFCVQCSVILEEELVVSIREKLEVRRRKGK